MSILVGKTVVSVLGSFFGYGEITLASDFPDATKTGDFLLAAVLAPGSQSNDPMDTPEGWTKTPKQSLHLGSFYKFASEDDVAAGSVTFTKKQGMPPSACTIIMITFRGVDLDKPLNDIAAYPCCEDAGDPVCAGDPGGLNNTAEQLGAHLTATRQDSGAKAGDNFDVVVISGNGDILTDNTPMHGTSAWKIIPSSAGGAGPIYVGWTDRIDTALGRLKPNTPGDPVTTGYARMYFKVTALPNTRNVTIMRFDETYLGNMAGSVKINTDGTLRVADSIVQQIDGTFVISANTWYRLVVKIVCDPSVGTVNAKLYSGDSLTVLDDVTATGNTMTEIRSVYYGYLTAVSTTTAGNMYIDDLNFNATADVGIQVGGANGNLLNPNCSPFGCPNLISFPVNYSKDGLIFSMFAGHDEIFPLSSPPNYSLIDTGTFNPSGQGDAWLTVFRNASSAGAEPAQVVTPAHGGWEHGIVLSIAFNGTNQITLPRAPLINLDGIYLTDQNREPVSNENSVGNKVLLASGIGKNIIVGKQKKTFTINWKNIPATLSQTVDGAAARDDIKLLGESSDSMILTYNDIDGSHTYTVIVDSYSETLNKRYLTNFYWDVTLTLVEV